MNWKQKSGKMPYNGIWMVKSQNQFIQISIVPRNGFLSGSSDTRVGTRIGTRTNLKRKKDPETYFRN
ncbi:MAG: hypothetical protein SV375_01495 [Thermodesulfobacteriota bacterium]|nr:hypothetical protein [Thermodesulfobacteriota bacterium]